MNERFTDLAFTKGDFNKATTSPSQTALTNWNWFLKYHLVNYLNFKPERPSISFQSGTFVHEYFQAFLQGRDFEDKDISAHYENKLNNMKLEERHLMKGKFIHKKINKFINKHIQSIAESFELNDWKVEVPFSDWYDEKYMGQKLNIANEGYIDCVNEKLNVLTEHKNRFGSVKLQPLKKKSTKETGNRIGDWVYSKAQKLKQPQFTHCIQVSIYAKHYNYKYKPHLIYVDDEEITAFTPDNCWELTIKGLQYFFKKFIQINIQRQEMLRMADGDIKKLACMIGVDWSEIRNFKSNFMLENYDEEDMQKLEDFYERL